MKKICVGELRTPIELYRPVKTPDYGGGWTVEYVRYAIPWAKVEPRSGNELLAGMQLQATITHRIHMRYRPDVKPKDIVVLDGERKLNIEYVINLEERNRWLELQCEEGGAFVHADVATFGEYGEYDEVVEQ